MPVQPPQEIVIGETTIQTSNQDFINGYQNGYLKFVETYQGKLLSDRHIYDFLVTNITSVQNPSFYNAGYILGWTAALGSPDALEQVYNALERGQYA